jgi:hypothetical protein
MHHRAIAISVAAPQHVARGGAGSAQVLRTTCAKMMRDA